MQVRNTAPVVSVGASLDIDLALNGERVVAIVANEVDSTNFKTGDLVQIILKNAGSEVPLKEGILGELSDLLYRGDITVTPPNQLIVRFLYPVSGAVCSVAFATASPAEPVSGNDVPQVMQVYPPGKIRLLFSDGVADALTLDVRPPVKTQWLFLDLWGIHNDGGAQTLNWGWYDATNLAAKNNFSVGGGVPVYFDNGLTASRFMPGACLFTHEVYGRLTATALGAGKKLQVRGAYMEFNGGS